MRKTNKPSAEIIAPENTQADLRAIERQESELRALENDEGYEEATGPSPLGSSTVDLAHLGLDEVAYIRRAVVDDVTVWSIYSAAGLPIGAAPSLEKAWGAIVQNDLQPVFVH